MLPEKVWWELSSQLNTKRDNETMREVREVKKSRLKEKVIGAVSDILCGAGMEEEEDEEDEEEEHH